MDWVWGLDIENPIGMSVGMRMTFENGYGYGYSYTCSEPVPRPSVGFIISSWWLEILCGLSSGASGK